MDAPFLYRDFLLTLNAVLNIVNESFSIYKFWFKNFIGIIRQHPQTFSKLEENIGRSLFVCFGGVKSRVE